MEGRTRSCWSGQPNELADVIAPCASVPIFLVYGETMDTPLQINRITPHRHMWRQLKTIVPNLSFTQSALESVMDEVYKRAKDGWPKYLTDAELGDWRSRMAKRIRAMGRAISQAEVKNKNAGWLLTLWKGPLPNEGSVAGSAAVAKKVEKEAVKKCEDEEEEECEDEEEECEDEEEEACEDEEASDEAEEEQPEPEAEKVKKRPAASMLMKRPAGSTSVLKEPAVAADPVYEFGFDVELESAWRRLLRKSKELTTNFKHDEKADDIDLCTVVFADGMEATIPGFDVQRMKEFRAVHVLDRGAEWQGVHEKTGDKLLIVKRADRSPLLCLYSQSQSAKKKVMVCMVKVMHFGDGDPARGLALQCLTELAEKFAKDLVTSDDIYSHRDALMRKMGATMPQKTGSSRKRATSSSSKASPTAPARKRPAATRKAATEDTLEPEESAMDIDLPPLNIMDEVSTVLGDMI